jgi:hemolysin III
MGKRNIYGYTLGEEIFSAVSHGVGGLLGIAALVLLIIFAAINGNALDVVGVCIYGATLIILYTISTLYHSLTNETAKKVFKVLDHCSIYLLIAGTFTPMCFSVMRSLGWKSALLITLIWLAAILGIVLYACFPKKLKILHIILYVSMGWSVLFLMKDLIATLKLAQAISTLYFLLAGGIAYTAGVIFYVFKKVKYFHSVFHLFVLAGSICHFFSVLFYFV